MTNSDDNGVEMAEQVDIEDAIANSWPTVREFAEQKSLPEWKVRRAIQDGLLIADRKERPMTIKGGVMPLTVREWQEAILPATRSIKPSVSSWGNGGREYVVLADDLTVHSFRIVSTRYLAEQQRQDIDRLKTRRFEAAL